MTLVCANKFKRDSVEKRNEERTGVEIGVKVIKDNFSNLFFSEKSNATLVDISAKGIRIEIIDEGSTFKKNDSVKVLIPLDVETTEPVIRGVVTNAIRGDGLTHMGINCEIKNDENDHLLAELVRAAILSKPDKLQLA